jgi:heme oxygenase
MRQIASLLVRLNLETRSFHAEADRLWLELVGDHRVPSRQDYMHALVRAYGFDAPLEAALRYTPHVTTLVDMTGRYRSGLIAQDLLTLGVAPAQVASIPQLMIAPFANLAEALGWLYVHERATLTHEAVRHVICDRVPGLVNACAYLSAYEGVVGARLDAFAQRLDQLTKTRAVADRVVTAAMEGFRRALQWIHAEDSQSHGASQT